MNNKQAYNYLLSISNIPKREYLKDSRHCEVYLKRLSWLLGLLGNPQNQIPHYIHVTGTSGKGSVCLMLSSILKASGKKVGTITSPHYSTITERWEINSQPVSQKQFIKLVAIIKPKLDEYLEKSPYEMPSFFEIVTALGLYHFAQNKIDWAVVEVGLGGRYDSTNVIPNNDVCVITNIGDDHKNIIGPTKKDIAYEKAGIIKKNCVVYTMEKKSDILQIIKKEFNKMEGNKFHVIKNNCYSIIKQNLSGLQFDYQQENFQLNSLGKHQISNSLLAIEVAKGLGIKNQDIKLGLKQVKLPLRMEIWQKNPLIILDGAHNADKMKSSIETIESIEELKEKKIHLVIGFSHDKEWPKMIKQLLRLNPQSVAATRFTNNIFRQVANPKEISIQIKKFSQKIRTKVFLDPLEAVVWSKQHAQKNDLILVTGSIFLSGEIRQV